MLHRLPRPTIFAHRGASAYAPENTLAAFELAVKQGAHAIELDAKLCADGQVVVIHDTTVDRTTDGSGRVGDLPLEALRELDAGEFFDASFRGERIPTLSEVLESIGRRLWINIELTNYTTPNDALPAKAAELVRHHGLQERVIFSSFNPLTLNRMKKELPRVPKGWLIAPGSWGAWSWRLLRGYISHEAVHPASQIVSPGWVTRIHLQGRRVHVYTVNRVEEIKRLLDWDVDGIFTDDPLLALQVVQEHAFDKDTEEET
ncbi:MAG: glycerophosphodiester phosphodiesterase family protein [Chloroflexota bacterium]